MKVNVEVQCTTEALDQHDGTSLGRLVGMACFLDQIRGDDAVDDAEHPAHALEPAGKQEAQLKGKAQLSSKVTLRVAPKVVNRYGVGCIS